MDDETRRELEGYALADAEHKALVELCMMAARGEDRRGINRGEPGYPAFVRRFLTPVEELTPAAIAAHRWWNRRKAERTA